MTDQEKETWTTNELRRIVIEACESQRREYAPVIAWAEARMAKEAQMAHRVEKLKTTVIGWSLIWVIGGFLYVVGEGVTTWIRKLSGLTPP